MLFLRISASRWLQVIGWFKISDGYIKRTTLGKVKVKVAQSCPTLCDSIHCTVHGIVQARILEWEAISSSRGSSQPGDQTQVSCIAGSSLPAEPPGKPRNTEVGSLSRLQQIFLTQESNQGLPHCRWILYQLSYGKSLL